MFYVLLNSDISIGQKVEEDPLESIDEISKVMNLVGLIPIILVFCDLINRIW